MRLFEFIFSHLGKPLLEMCCFHMGIARKEGWGAGYVKACQDGFGHFFPTVAQGCKGLPGWYGALFFHVCPFDGGSLWEGGRVWSYLGTAHKEPRRGFLNASIILLLLLAWLVLHVIFYLNSLCCMHYLHYLHYLYSHLSLVSLIFLVLHYFYD